MSEVIKKYVKPTWLIIRILIMLFCACSIAYYSVLWLIDSSLHATIDVVLSVCSFWMAKEVCYP